MILSNLRIWLLSGLSIGYLSNTVGSDPLHATKPRKGTSPLKDTKNEKESEFEILKGRWLEDFETENQETQVCDKLKCLAAYMFCCRRILDDIESTILILFF